MRILLALLLFAEPARVYVNSSQLRQDGREMYHKRPDCPNLLKSDAQRPTRISEWTVEEAERRGRVPDRLCFGKEKR